MGKATKLIALASTIAVLALLGAPRGVLADTIGPSNCQSCDGNSYTLTYSQPGAQAGTDNYTITLTIDATGFNAGSGYLGAVAPGIPGSNSVKLINAPGALSDWTTMSGGISAGGCDSHGSPFFCSMANSTGSFNAVPTSSMSPDLVFVWTITDSSISTSGDSIKAWYESIDGSKIGAITSEDITLQPSTNTPAPEPATFGLVWIGLMGVAVVLGRRQLKIV